MCACERQSVWVGGTPALEGVGEGLIAALVRVRQPPLLRPNNLNSSVYYNLNDSKYYNLNGSDKNPPRYSHESLLDTKRILDLGKFCLAIMKM